MTRPPSVLILTASYGSGHNRAASALAEAFASVGVGARVVDHFRELVHPAVDRLTRTLYQTVLRRTPPLWGMAYWLGDQIPVSSPLLLGLTRLGMAKLGRLLDAERPDAVVSVHPTPAAALSELVAAGRRVPPHTTVFTDFVAHTQWIYPHVDRYCVPAPEIARMLIARGVPRARVVVTGIPVMADFVRPAGERAATRLALGLSPRLPVLLLMDGANGGLGRLEEALRVLLRMSLPCQALVVAGRAPRLGARLGALAAGREGRVKVFGHVDNVHQLMGAADILVSKAGGATLAEALAAELPLVCFGSLPGQETRNERFAAMAGVALLARTAVRLEQALSSLLADPALMQSLRSSIRDYRRPRAAATIVELMLGLRSGVTERAS